jgi:hypothetical protein
MREQLPSSSSLRNEYLNAVLPDQRLADRLLDVAAGLFERPERSFPDSYDSAGLEGTYRFFSNKRVSSKAILGPHQLETAKRIEQESCVLALHDTTSFSFATTSVRKGLGRKKSAGQCFFAHATLAVSADGERRPLGVLGLSTYVRDAAPSAGREAGRWLKQIKAVGKLPAICAQKLIHVADRESDSFATLHAMQLTDTRFVLRVSKDRRVRTSTGSNSKLDTTLSQAKAIFTREASLSERMFVRRSPIQAKLHPNRAARVAQLHVSASRIELLRPKSFLKSELTPSLTVNVVRVWEPKPPAGEAPIEWQLFTSEPIETAANLEAIIDYYRARWVIEEYFKALKTGCRFEERQLESFHSLRNALAVFAPIAWNLLRLRTSAREQPDAPADGYISKYELTVLRTISRIPIKKSPTRHEVLLAIAALGGHIKFNGAPGWITLNRGYQKLTAVVEGFKLARNIRKKCDQS